MIRRLRPFAVVAAVLALLFGVGLASAAFACDAAQGASLPCAASRCAGQVPARSCALACAPVTPAIAPTVPRAGSLSGPLPTPSATAPRALVSRPTAPEPPPPRPA